MSILEIKNLNLGFNIDEKFYPVLKNINFNLKCGKIHAIVGESGSGKTISCMSILKLLPDNTKITSGQILYKNVNLLELNEKAIRNFRGREIALIPQDPMTSLNPLYTIFDQLYEVVLLHYKISKKEAKELIVSTLKKVNISNPEQRLNNYPHKLSGGMKQRIIIACALLGKAKIIIADEPTTALDVTIQAQIMHLLLKLKNENNVSIILITHDLALVSQYSDEISVMYNGQIVEHANTGEIFYSPKHPYTKALIESVPSYTNNRKIEPIYGNVPSIYDEINGCPFHLRCKYMFAPCKTINPNLKKVDNHIVRCHLYSNLDY